MRIEGLVGNLAAFCAATVVLAAGLPGATRAGRLPIQLDGVFDDWTAPSIHQDPAGDAGSATIDLGGLWAADDPNTLYLRFEVGSEQLLNAGNDLVLYLDTDMDDRTGLSIGGIGAELEWRFGTRSGSYRSGAGVTGIRHG